MNKFLVTIIAFGYVVCGYAQDASILTKDSDTTYWLSYRNNQFDLNDNLPIYFRLQTPCHSIEVSQSSGKVQGIVQFFVRENDDSLEANRVFKKKFIIDDNVANQVFKMVDSSKINLIPSDKFIKSWKYGFDGVTYIVEYKNQGIYSFKSYWTPSAQDNVKEAKVIQDFVSHLYELINITKLQDLFEKDILFRSWSCDEKIITRPFKESENREYEKKND